MKTLILPAILALAAAPASAGDIHWSFGFGSKNKGVRIGVGVHDKHRHRSHRDRAHRRSVHRTHRDIHRHRIHRHRPVHYCNRHFVPVRYEYVQRKVWIPGHYDKVHVPAQYGWTYDACGNRVRTLIRAAHYETVHHAGRFEYRRERVRRGGYWTHTCNTPGHCHPRVDRRRR